MVWPLHGLVLLAKPLRPSTTTQRVFQFCAPRQQGVALLVFAPNCNPPPLLVYRQYTGTTTMAYLGEWAQISHDLTIELAPIGYAVGYVAPARPQDGPITILLELGIYVCPFLDRLLDMRATCRQWYVHAEKTMGSDIRVALSMMEREGLYGLLRVHDRLVVRMQTPITRAWTPNSWYTKWANAELADGTPDPFDAMVLVDARALVCLSVSRANVFPVSSKMLYTSL